jgi:transcriptional regulator GlxA family with amidase domain
VEFIRSVKLDKAAVLLERSDMNPVHVSYGVGFSSPKRSLTAQWNFAGFFVFLIGSLRSIFLK